MEKKKIRFIYIPIYCMAIRVHSVKETTAASSSRGRRRRRWTAEINQYVLCVRVQEFTFGRRNKYIEQNVAALRLNSPQSPVSPVLRAVENAQMYFECMGPLIRMHTLSAFRGRPDGRTDTSVKCRMWRDRETHSHCNAQQDWFRCAIFEWFNYANEIRAPRKYNRIFLYIYIYMYGCTKIGKWVEFEHAVAHNRMWGWGNSYEIDWILYVLYLWP